MKGGVFTWLRVVRRSLNLKNLATACRNEKSEEIALDREIHESDS